MNNYDTQLEPPDQSREDEEIERWKEHHALDCYNELLDDGEPPNRCIPYSTQSSKRTYIGDPVQMTFAEWMEDESTWWFHFEEWAESQQPDEPPEHEEPVGWGR